MTLRQRIRRWVKDMTRAPRFYGANQLDAKVLPYIDRKKGIFIEAGANNGLTQSNTAYLERFRGWRGVLVEPVPEVAEVCRRNRPRSKVFTAALVPFDFPDKTIRIHYAGLMSLVDGAMAPGQREEHLRIGRDGQRPRVERDVAIPSEIDVPARTLTSILDESGYKAFDFFSLDVEGFELQVLRGLDFDRYRPKWMLVEVWNREGVDSLLKGIYEPVAELSHHDVLYRALRA